MLTRRQPSGWRLFHEERPRMSSRASRLAPAPRAAVCHATAARAPHLTHAPRLALAALDVLFLAATATCLWGALARPALAYVDPSVMTYTIQALAGVAVALSAVLGVVWRRARRWLLRAMHVDENAGKAVEPTVHALDAAETSADARAASLASADDAARDLMRPRKPFAPTLRWRTRLVLAFVCALVLSLCVFFVAPLEVVIPGCSSLSFSLANVWLPLVVLALLAAAAIALAASATCGRAFDVVLAVIAAVCVCTLLQEVLLNRNLPSADGSLIDWSIYDKCMLVSTVVWLVVIAAFVAFALIRPLWSRVAAVAACLVICLAQGVGLGALAGRYAEALSRPTVTEEGLTSVSSKSNVIVFVLDMFDTKDMDDVMAAYPDAADELDGFTWYHNSVGSMIPTRYGIPFIVTGHDFDPSSSTFDTQQLESWFSDRNLLNVANDQGYSVGVYSDSVTYGLNALEGKTINVHTVEPFFADFFACAKALGGCGLYRDLPYPLKPIFWFTTDQLNDAVVPTDARTPENTPYVLDDAELHREFSQPVIKADDTAEAGAYRIIHCQGSHWPYIMDQNGNTVQVDQSDHASLVNQARGSLSIVEEYIRQLKDLGVYDQSTIVITADHGVWPWNHARLNKTTSPILLVKPAGADASTPMQISEVPTGHVDLPATLEWAAGAWSGSATDATGSSTVMADGKPVFEVTDGDRPRLFYWNDHDGKVDWHLVEYEVDGKANEFSSWHETGRVWDVDMEGYNQK